MFTTSKLLASHGVRAVFSDRYGGVSNPPFDSLNLGLGLGDLSEHVHANLTLLCHYADLTVPHQAQQVHGVKVLYCQGVGQIHDVQADILIATEKGVPLAVRTADCVPILLADTQAKVVAAVHAGWKGTVAQVVQVAVREMCKVGAKPEHILASLGPSIADCCFEVNADMATTLNASCDEIVSKRVGQKHFANLMQTNVAQLLMLGLQHKNIECSKSCTVCHTSPQYFSYRRDKGETGRQLSVMMLL